MLKGNREYRVHTINIDKARDMADYGRHIQHDFGTYGILAEMNIHWMGVAFSKVIMNYLYTLTYWDDDHWKEEMYITLLTMAERGALLPLVARYCCRTADAFEITWNGYVLTSHINLNANSKYPTHI